MYSIVLTDSTGSLTLPLLNVPLSEETLEGSVDVVTLDMGIYTDFTVNKRQWGHTWATLSEDDFNDIKGYYDRQFTSGSYPQVTISELGVSAVPARMYLSPREIRDNCGRVQNVTITLREK